MRPSGLLRESSSETPCALRPLETTQVHGTQPDGEIPMEPWGCLTGLYSRVGKPHTMQVHVPCMSLCVTLHVTPVPCMFPSRKPLPCSYTKYRQSRQDARINCITQRDPAHMSPLKAAGPFVWPSLKAGGTLPIGPVLQLWETAPLNCPESASACPTT